MSYKKYKRIGMVVAMEKEIAPILNELGTFVKSSAVCGLKIDEYSCKDKTLFICQSGIGEISASSATSILIGVFNCEAIINFGVCGTLTKHNSVLETVFVSGVVHYDFDLTATDDVIKGQYPEYPSAVIDIENELFSVIKSVNENAKFVICASADKFLEDETIKSELFNTYGATVCDMESAGIALVCKRADIPLVMIKAVSDGEGGASQFNKMVKLAVNSYREITLKILEAF